MNASCYQYDGMWVCPLPRTGFTLVDVILPGAILLFLGLYVAWQLRRPAPEIED